MTRIKTIIVPFDFSHAGKIGLQYALTLFGLDNAVKIIAVHSVINNPEDDSRKEFQAYILSQKKLYKIPPTLEITNSPLVQGVNAVANKYAADLIIIGTGDHTHVLEGGTLSKATTLVMHSSHPVITVSTNFSIEKPKEIALLLGKDEIDRVNVLETLLKITRRFKAKVHVLTIYQDHIFFGEKDYEVSESNDETLEYYLEHFYEEHSFAQFADIEKGIQNYITKHNIDMLAILPRHHATKTEPSEGRLTKLLTLHSSIPVLALI
ncbi:universal stress protein [Aegicerativicinus sediminis]|uniref:universal stress protein n=1 Tax=Aegicerativicinus sediminis TaxID=2893202 RepID=UPI001E55299E|nr:universal stress protein [Aegicerativicinus sediminis]